jgi:hypothetical protein
LDPAILLTRVVQAGSVLTASPVSVVGEDLEVVVVCREKNSATTVLIGSILPAGEYFVTYTAEKYGKTTIVEEELLVKSPPTLEMDDSKSQYEEGYDSRVVYIETNSEVVTLDYVANWSGSLVAPTLDTSELGVQTVLYRTTDPDTGFYTEETLLMKIIDPLVIEPVMDHVHLFSNSSQLLSDYVTVNQTGVVLQIMEEEEGEELTEEVAEDDTETEILRLQAVSVSSGFQSNIAEIRVTTYLPLKVVNSIQIEPNEEVDFYDMVTSDFGNLALQVFIDGVERTQPVQFDLDGVYGVSFVVTDSFGTPTTDAAVIQVTVRSKVPPSLEFIGGMSIWVPQGSTYEDLGVRVHPESYGEASKTIKDEGGNIVSEILTTSPARYTIKYTIHDYTDQEIHLERLVTVATTPTDLDVHVLVNSDVDDVRDHIHTQLSEKYVVPNNTWSFSTEALVLNSPNTNSFDAEPTTFSDKVRITVNVIAPPVLELSKNQITLERGRSTDLKSYVLKTDQPESLSLKLAGKIIESDMIFETPGYYSIDFMVQDTHGFTKLQVLEVVVSDTLSPVIELVGSNLTIIPTAQTYTDYGVFVQPELDGIVEEANDRLLLTLSINGVVSVTQPMSSPLTFQLDPTHAVFNVEYEVSDMSGNKSNIVSRTILVGYISMIHSSLSFGASDFTGQVEVEGVVIPVDLSDWPNNILAVKSTWSDRTDTLTGSTLSTVVMNFLSNIFNTTVSEFSEQKVKDWLNYGTFSKLVFTEKQVEDITASLGDSSEIKPGNMVGIQVNLEASSGQLQFLLMLKHEASA